MSPRPVQRARLAGKSGTPVILIEAYLGAAV
jgi:hypothetical protein